MNTISITSAEAHDLRFPLPGGMGSDALHRNPTYSYAITVLHSANGLKGVGLTFTLGRGNELVCSCIQLLLPYVNGCEIEELMANFGQTFREMSNDSQLRWLGPHKGVVHLALASITNACFDLWAKARRQPLWKLLLDLTPEEVVNLLDLTYLEDALTAEEAIDILRQREASRVLRESVLREGYPAYDTSVGWFSYSDYEIQERARCSINTGFRAVKLKVGAPTINTDLRRAEAIRAAIGSEIALMLDANQKWNPRDAVDACRQLAAVDPFWIEEPTHPDDVHAHRKLAQAIAPTRLAAGEHIANRIQFKNYLQSGGVSFVQADTTRIGGVTEFIVVSLLARKFGVPVTPHAGDMSQIHQHLVFFNHVAIGHPVLFLEYIPALRSHFVIPAHVENGLYAAPLEPGNS